VTEESWRALYMTAILETDPDKLAWCVQAVENAINERVASLDGQIKDEELRAIADARLGLGALKREVEQRRTPHATT
jgi:hypothetical protein